MNVNSKSSRRIASALLLGLMLAGCASGPSAPPSPELSQRIESARTRGDHEALATYYDQQASAARATASDHRKLAKTYQQGMAVDPKDPRGGGTLPSHCNVIARNQDGISAEYEGLAAAHRQLAKQAQP
ncbi:MAG: hypothetical protein ABL900_00210 [Burkholderiaceae bacterium]